MNKVFDSLLLLALPASGKSEIRKYLAQVDHQKSIEDFHIGKTVQLDDFPYVHLMRRIDEELKKTGEKSVFFHSPDKPFMDPVTWGVLIHLLNEDYDDLLVKKQIPLDNCSVYLLKRIDNARRLLGVKPLFFEGDKPFLDGVKWKAFTSALEEDARDIVVKKMKEYPDTLDGKTVVIEFARGGPDKAEMPLLPPLGYEYSLGLLKPEILEKSALLYVWVTPEESRRKNFERTDPNDPGSILAHGVPIDVMMNDYGCDDINYLLSVSDKSGFVKVDSNRGPIYLPTQKFDNRDDKTTFVRGKNWKEGDVERLHKGLKESLTALYERYSTLHQYSR
ncbi:MAG: hypothetical protein M1536_05890 [Firmicutes bacterium]|nr:hypothetical protein [Bacillota bacterium]